MRVAICVSIVAAGLAIACKGGTQTGTTGSSEDRFELPLVGSLEDGLLLTPVSVNAAGPYLFAIDPDASMSVVDADVIKEGRIRTFEGAARLDETNAPQPRIYADLVNVEIGSLVIERRTVVVVKNKTFDSGGRRIYGVIGRDVFPEGAVVGFKRDRAIAVVLPTEQFRPAANAITIPYETLAMRVPNAEGLPVPRRIAKATVNGGGPFTMHLDLGAVPSQLRDASWENAKLVAKELEGALVDEVGTVRKFDKISEPTHVELASLASDKVVFVPYAEKRWEEVDGAIGLGFFAPYDVWLNWDKKTLHLEPRSEATYQQRIDRWDFGPIAKCEHPGCVTVRLVDPLAGKPLEEGKEHPGVVLSLTRDEKAGGTDLEVVLEPQGKPELPRLIVNMPPNADRVIDHLGPEWVGVALTVIDASPFPRHCQHPGPCIDRFSK